VDTVLVYTLSRHAPPHVCPATKEVKDNYEKGAEKLTIAGAWYCAVTIRGLDSIGTKRICTVTLSTIFQTSISVAATGTFGKTDINRLSRTGAEIARQHSSAVILIAMKVSVWGS